ncbi:hypothetical protein QUA43_10100 [Microcoleus sp. N9_B4]
MSESSFEKTNLSWQLGQLQQRVEEWWELKYAQNIANVKLPSLFDSPILGRAVSFSCRGCPPWQPHV